MCECMHIHHKSIVAATVAIIAVPSVSSSLCNSFDKSHDLRCPSGESIWRVLGSHSNKKEDRTYCYGCRNNLRKTTKASHCYSTGYVNDWDKPVATLCKPNYYIAGVESYHDNKREDRRFSYTCCVNPKQCTRNCYLDGPVNDFDGIMVYKLGKDLVMVGAFSWHRNNKE